MTHNSTLKAAIVTSVLSMAGIAGIFFAPSGREGGAHLVGLYLLLLVHTFYSIRCFSAIIDPKDLRQLAVDFALVISYLGLAWSIRDELIFWLWWIILFSLAATKYALLVGRLHYPILLRRKLLADLGGLAFGFCYFLLVPFVALYVFKNQSLLNADGYKYGALAVFAIVSAYYFFIRPLYVPDKMSAL